MDLKDAANLISTLAVIAGVFFAVIQLRQHGRARDREAALALVQSFQTPEFSRALRVLFALPEDMDLATMEALPAAEQESIYMIVTTFESLGAIVHRGEIGIELVEDFFSGPIVLGWRNLGRAISELRRRTGRDTLSEWFQWLAERVSEREDLRPPKPAYLAYRDWRPQP